MLPIPYIQAFTRNNAVGTATVVARGGTGEIDFHIPLTADRLKPSSLTVTADKYGTTGHWTITDNGVGVWTGDVGGIPKTVDYATGDCEVVFAGAVDGGIGKLNVTFTQIHAIAPGTVVGVGDGTAGPYALSLGHTSIFPGTVSIQVQRDDTGGYETVGDDGAGHITGYGTGSIDYVNGSASITFTSAIKNASDMTVLVLEWEELVSGAIIDGSALLTGLTTRVYGTCYTLMTDPPEVVLVGSAFESGAVTLDLSTFQITIFSVVIQAPGLVFAQFVDGTGNCSVVSSSAAPPFFGSGSAVVVSGLHRNSVGNALIFTVAGIPTYGSLLCLYTEAGSIEAFDCVNGTNTITGVNPRQQYSLVFLGFNNQVQLDNISGIGETGVFYSLCKFLV